MATAVSSSQHGDHTISPSWFKVQKTSSGPPFVALPDKDRSFQVFLTKFYKTDEVAQANILDHPAVNRALISPPCPYTVDDARSWIKFALQPSQENYHHVIRAHDPENGLFIGCISYNLVETSTGEKRRELGYYLSVDFQRKGIMRDAVVTSLAWAAELGISDVTVKVVEDNLASRAVIQSIDAFKFLDNREEVVWPESKGGGTKRFMTWRKQ